MIVVVGAGAAGLVAAVFAATSGQRVVLLERTADGGQAFPHPAQAVTVVPDGGAATVVAAVDLHHRTRRGHGDPEVAGAGARTAADFLRGGYRDGRGRLKLGNSKVSECAVADRLTYLSHEAQVVRYIVQGIKVQS